jgi:hypothetical protein
MNKLILACLALCLLFPVVSCSGPDSNVPSEINSEEEARGAAISYLQDNYEERAPSTGGDWQGKDITPEGLLGRRVIEFNFGDWRAVVSCPVVAPENIQYEVIVENVASGWYWRGIVEPNGYVAELVPFQEITQDKSLQIAEEFVKNSPTFQFDGIKDSLVLVETLYPDIEYAWQFIFAFDSRHSGYGDRSGENLLQVIAPHEVSVIVEKGVVISARMDDQWDMLEQELIQ